MPSGESWAAEADDSGAQGRISWAWKRCHGRDHFDHLGMGLLRRSGATGST
jgi:hypothetical protein